MCCGTWQPDNPNQEPYVPWVHFVGHIFTFNWGFKLISIISHFICFIIITIIIRGLYGEFVLVIFLLRTIRTLTPENLKEEQAGVRQNR